MKTRNCSLALVLALPLCILAAGCASRSAQSDSDNGSSASTMANANAAGSQDPANGTSAADNSAKNEQNQGGYALTAEDQGSSPEDRNMTRNIRKSLMDTSYSMTAKNIKIITVNGKVTLRGPVNSQDEKTGVETLVKNIAGETNVDDQLEIKSNP